MVAGDKCGAELGAELSVEVACAEKDEEEDEEERVVAAVSDGALLDDEVTLHGGISLSGIGNE